MADFNLDDPKKHLVIAVISEGNVIVGKTATLDPTDANVTLLDASVIRVWGTNAGLGQLALHGPREATVLDYCGYVSINRSQLLFLLECDQKAWPQ